MLELSTSVCDCEDVLNKSSLFFQRFAPVQFFNKVEIVLVLGKLLQHVAAHV